MSARRFMALFDGLGIDNALHRSLAPDTWFWSNTEELLALLIEVVDKLDRDFIRANSDKSATQPKPIQLKRPGKPQRRKGTTLAEFQAMMNGL